MAHMYGLGGLLDAAVGELERYLSAQNIFQTMQLAATLSGAHSGLGELAAGDTVHPSLSSSSSTSIASFAPPPREWSESKSGAASPSKNKIGAKTPAESSTAPSMATPASTGSASHSQVWPNNVAGRL